MTVVGGEMGAIWKGSLVILGATVVVAGGLIWANRAGICLSEGRRLTDDELLEAAWAPAMQLREATIRLLIEDGEVPPSSNIPRYDDPIQFAADHPDCCAIIPFEPLREEEQPPDWARNLGYFRAYVSIRYDIGPDQVEEGSVIIDNCGGWDIDFY